MNKEINIQGGWDFVFNKMFCQKTKLIYDYRTSESKNGAIAHLPTKEEIARNYPNPCGWYTGMEDSDLNGGMMLDAVLYRFETTKDGAMKKYADDLFEGLALNAEVSGQSGFLVRARLPEDGITHYINSSRDQYTHWIFAMIHFYFSELSDEKQRERIKKSLIAFAAKAERDVVEENLYSLLNEEGKPAMVCAMKGEDVVWHESLRLPMFYLAAYAVSNDLHWLEMYRKTRDWGLETAETIKFSRETYALAFALMQMQLSVRLLYDFETDENYKKRYLSVMTKVADFSAWYVPAASVKLKDFRAVTSVPSWRNCPKECVSEYKNYGEYGYDVIFNDVYTAAVGDRMSALRNGAEGFIVQLLCPDKEPSEETVKSFEKILENVDFSDSFSYIPVPYCLAWWFYQKRII